MASAMGAGLGADMLQEVLKRKLVEQAQLAQQAQFQQNLAEQARQANQRNALGNRQIDQNASEFTANAPIREATVGHMGAETASLNRAPVEAEKERTYKSGESQKGRDFTAGQETQREAFTAGKFVCPHGACFDRKGNIFVAEWVEVGRVTKLRKV